jgi:hypothetical protein
MLANCPPPDCLLSCCDFQGRCPTSLADCYAFSPENYAETLTGDISSADSSSVVYIVIVVLVALAGISCRILHRRRVQERLRRIEQMQQDLLRQQIAQNNQALLQGANYPAYQPPNEFQGQGQYIDPQRNFAQDPRINPDIQEQIDNSPNYQRGNNNVNPYSG